jgi:hypothetical protein
MTLTLHVYALTCIVTELLMEYILYNMFLYIAAHEPYESESVSSNLLKDILHLSTIIEATNRKQSLHICDICITVSVHLDV